MKKLGLTALLAALLATAATTAEALDEILMVDAGIAPRLCDSTYYGLDGSYKIQVPDLASKVFVKDQVITPLTTTHATFGALDTGYLFVVSTNIRSDLSDYEKVLDEVEAHLKSQAAAIPGAVSTQRGTGQFGKNFVAVVLNPISSGNPLARGDVAGVYPTTLAFGFTQKLGTVAVHRYFVANQHSYQFAAMIHTFGTMADKSKEELLAKANEWLDMAIKNFTPGRFAGCSSGNASVAQHADGKQNDASASTITEIPHAMTSANAHCGPRQVVPTRRARDLPLETLRTEAEAGDEIAQNELGRRYGVGNGITKDSQLSFQWYGRAAAQDHCDAQTNLAYMYFSGEGTAKNMELAKSWYIKAAEQGNPRAQYQLGYMAATGIGSKKNGEDAERWFLVAANQGLVQAQQVLVTLYREGKLVPQNSVNAELWQQRVSDAMTTGRPWRQTPPDSP